MSEVISLAKGRGGVRRGAGRKPGFTKYGEATEAIRIPSRLKKDIIHYVENKGFNLPVYAMRVPMGAAKDSVDFVDHYMNLNQLVQHPDKTFFHPVEGDSMEPTIYAGDLAMVDSAIEAMHGDIVLAMIDGGLTLKRYRKINNRVWLDPDNKDYKPIFLDPNLDNIICGVMLISIRPVSTNHISKF